MAIVGVARELPALSEQVREEVVIRTRRWHVESTIPNEDFAVVRSAQGIPAYGAAHPTVADMYVVDIETTQNDENRNIWLVTATYQGYRIGGQWGDDERRSPIDMPPTIVRMTQKSQEAIDTDVFGNAITNSAGEDYDPPVVADRSRLVYVIGRYVAQPRDDVYSRYADAVNSDSWRPWTSTEIYPPWTVRVDDIQCELTQIQQYRVFREQWTLIVFFGMPNEQAPGGWWGHQLRSADRGRRQFAITRDNKLTFEPIKDKEGEPITEPVPLNGFGFAFDTDPTSVARGSGTVWRLNQIYRALPFSVLGLGG